MRSVADEKKIGGALPEVENAGGKLWKRGRGVDRETRISGVMKFNLIQYIKN